jgi:DNA-binding MarR family transcriptional regulator
MSNLPSGPPGPYTPDRFQPDQSVGYLMRRVMGSIRSQVDTRLATTCDTTYVQWLPLYKLMLHGDSTTASLARDLEIDPGAVTRSVDRLVAKGLVQRERSQADRRVVHLVLTPEGRRAAARVPAVLADVLNAHLQGFSEAEWQQLLQFLNRMLANGEALRQAHND